MRVWEIFHLTTYFLSHAINSLLKQNEIFFSFAQEEKGCLCHILKQVIG